jgi:predicted DNA-binding transcriptional regulator AlpA
MAKQESILTFQKLIKLVELPYGEDWRSTLSRIKNSNFPHHMDGRKYFFLQSEVEEWINKRFYKKAK